MAFCVGMSLFPHMLISILKSVVTGQTPVTLEGKNTPGKVQTYLLTVCRA